MLRTRLRQAEAWLLLGAIQGLVGLLVLLLPVSGEWILLEALVGVCLVQWLVLRQTGRQAGWWLLAYGLGWAAAIAALALLLTIPLTGLFVGALLGAVTGVVLIPVLGA